MAVYRVERTRDYTVMSNYHLKDTSLSLKAKGLLSMFLSFPEDWNYSTRGLAAICKEGVDAIGSTIKELEKAGYIIRRQLRGANGRITDTEYIIYEKPQPQEPPAPDADEPDMPPPDTASPHTENPDVAGPDMAAPHTENPAQLNINQFKTQKSNTQRSNTHSFPPPASSSQSPLSSVSASGENCARSLAPPLPAKTAALGFVGDPTRAQHSGSCGERRSSGMSEPCRLRRGEGYGACDDAVCGHGTDEAVKNDIAVAERLRITATTLDGILTVKGQGRGKQKV